MTRRVWIGLGLGVLLLMPAVSRAGNCVITTTRTACPGQEADSYKKCGGKPTCDESFAHPTAESCAAEAEEACVNVKDRQQVTKSKTITAKFDGQPVDGGKNFCDPGREDFNKCK
jgi:hypothetical protein